MTSNYVTWALIFGFAPSLQVQIGKRVWSNSGHYLITYLSLDFLDNDSAFYMDIFIFKSYSTDNPANPRDPFNKQVSYFGCLDTRQRNASFLTPKDNFSLVITLRLNIINSDVLLKI